MGQPVMGPRILSKIGAFFSVEMLHVRGIVSNRIPRTVPQVESQNAFSNFGQAGARVAPTE
jgi:hypothetical protein